MLNRASSQSTDAAQRAVLAAAQPRTAAELLDYTGPLEELRSRMPLLCALDDGALERILQKSNELDKLRGQLVEELGGVRMAQLAEELGPDHRFIRGDRISLDGKQATDGIIVRPVADEPGNYEIVAIAEAKAGRPSSRDLQSSSKSFASLDGQELENLECEAIEEVRKEFRSWASSDQLRETHAAEIAAQMRELHGPDMGQLQRDLERLMPGIDELAVEILLDGELVQVRASRNRIDFFAITPSDVRTDRMLDRLGELGINAQPAPIELTGRQLSAIARDLQEFQGRREAIKGEEGLMSKMSVAREAAAMQTASNEQSARQSAAATQDNRQQEQQATEKGPQNRLERYLDFLMNGIQFDNAADKQRMQKQEEAATRQQDDGWRQSAGADMEQSHQQNKDRDNDEKVEEKKEVEETVRAGNDQNIQSGAQIDMDRATGQAEDERLAQDRIKAANAGEDLDRARQEQTNQANTREQQESAEKIRVEQTMER